MEEEEDDEEEEEEESETEEEAATTDSHARQSGPGPVGNTQLAPPVAGQTAGTDKEDAAPSYSGPATGSGINIGQNGYAVRSLVCLYISSDAHSVHRRRRRHSAVFLTPPTRLVPMRRPARCVASLS